MGLAGHYVDQLHILGARGLDNVDHRSTMEVETQSSSRREDTMATETAYRVGGFMSHRLVCTDCVAPVLRRIKAGLSEVAPQPQYDIPAGAVCADCDKAI